MIYISNQLQMSNLPMEAALSCLIIDEMGLIATLNAGAMPAGLMGQADTDELNERLTSRGLIERINFDPLMSMGGSASPVVLNTGDLLVVARKNAPEASWRYRGFAVLAR